MEIKFNLPLLPLRDIVVFPNMVIPLFVGRDKSINALNEVMKKEKKIILVTQKNSEVDDPNKNDVFTYGCESNILQLLKLPDGTVNASKVCSTCHGNVAGMEQVAQVQPLKMGQCVACHRANEASVGCETCHH